MRASPVSRYHPWLFKHSIHSERLGQHFGSCNAAYTIKGSTMTAMRIRQARTLQSGHTYVSQYLAALYSNR